MNGMVTQLNLQAAHPGEYCGQSAQFSGDGYSGMHFTVRAVPREDFVQWLNSVRNKGSELGRDAYANLSRQSRNVRPVTYRAVEPGLFQAIVTQQIPPAPGPSLDSGSQSVRVPHLELYELFG